MFERAVHGSLVRHSAPRYHEDHSVKQLEYTRRWLMNGAQDSFAWKQVRHKIE